MRLKVNGADVYVRGANVVPMDEMEARLTDAAAVRMVTSAAEARMNMLRIWGGGIYQPQAFYDAADALGILIYHDAT